MSHTEPIPEDLTLEQKRALLKRLLQKKESRVQTAPVSFSQQRLWVLHEIEGPSATYNMRFGLELNGRLSTHDLYDSLKQVVARHGSLRTTFAAGDDLPIQQITPTADTSLTMVDLQGLECTLAETYCQRLMVQAARKLFDLTQGPLHETILFRLGPCRHRLLLVMHHIITDGLSMSVFLRDVMAFYRTAAIGEALTLPSLPLTYDAYSTAQRERFQGDTLTRDVDFWRETLKGAPALLELPTDRPRPAVQTFRGGRCDLTLKLSTANALRDLARHHHTTIYVTLLAGFAVLLSRYSGQNDVVIGSPHANRRDKAVRDLIGFFVNTMVPRADMRDNPSFIELMARLRNLMRDALSHMELPFEKLVRELKPARRTDHQPIFQVMFVLQNFAVAPFDLPGVQVVPQTVETGTVKFDLHLFMTDAPDGLTGYMEYNRDLFDDQTIAAMLNHFSVLLERLAEDPNQSVGQVEMLSQAESRRLLHEWNPAPYDFGPVVPIHNLIAQQAVHAGATIAILFEGNDLTYSDLNKQSNILAARLRGLGVGPDTPVAVCLDRSLSMVIALLAVLKAGGAYIPLDPDYPRERLAYMLKDAEPKVLISQGAALDRLPDHQATVLGVDEPVAEEPKTSEPRDLQPENLAYIIYTSGSTGKPKGAMNTHRALWNRLQWMQRAFQLNQSDRVMQKTPFSFDVSVWEFFWPLMTGAGLVVARPGGHMDPGYLKDLIKAGRVTTMHFVPSMLRQFLEEPGLETCKDLKRVIASGEALTPDVTARFYKCLPKAALHNLYGPTEAAIDVSWHACEPNEARRSVPIGAPIDNIQLHILTDTFNLTPIGLPGALYIGGVGLARGYWLRPDLTAERFVPNSFATDPGQRLYATGDLARMLHSGEIEFLGRLDFQVKLRGLRIELGEIEGALRDHPTVEDAAVLVRELGGEQVLAAYITGEAVSPSDLRQALAARLPAYMVPAHIVPMAELPLSPNGKLERRALMDLPLNDAGKREQFVPPASPTAAVLAEIWCDLLGLERVGMTDNFFDLGGHSLLLLKLRTKIRERLGRDIPVVEMFNYPTIRDQVCALETEVNQQTDHLAPVSEVPVGGDIAVIGMAGRFPGAPDLDTFWRNLVEGVESVRFFDDETLARFGVSRERLADPRFVKAGAVLDGVDQFDADFFGIPPREAELMDLQKRLLLECAHQAMEHAGYPPESVKTRIGVWTGIGVNSYLLRNLLPNQTLIDNVGEYAVYLGNNPDFTATQLAYRLNLKGPAVNVATACSTSLVAVHESCRALLAGECEMALAGGSNVSVPSETGYFYIKESIRAEDGHCRAFDVMAGGTVFGDGVGVVLLKPLAQAQRDGDTIHAVIKGSAINNDGSRKMGYTAPSIEGQAEVIQTALQRAGLTPAEIGFLEAHGTGTTLGDPIEVAALTRVFGQEAAKGSIALGSVKTNVGHLDAAAGIAGFLKTVLSLRNGKIPASLNCTEPNPQIDWDSSPFFVNTTTRDWAGDDQPRRAGVSAFGIGGTNAHVVLEQAPQTEPEPYSGTEPHLFLVSAKSQAALDQACINLADHLQNMEPAGFKDAAYTLAVGRTAYPYRRAVVASTGSSAAEALRNPTRTVEVVGDEPSPVFLFPGQGAQYVDMGRGLYERYPVYREQLDACCELLKPLLDIDLRELLFPSDPQRQQAAAQLARTRYTQPAVFTVSYAMAKLWRSLGVNPCAVLGHSVGAYAAACLAGVFSLKDALTLIAARGCLIDELPGGAMLALPLTEAEITPLLKDGLALAAVNKTNRCVVAGPIAAIDELAARFPEGRRLATSHAFHSEMMEPMLKTFADHVAKVTRNAPQIPMVSDLTGTWLDEETAVSVDYWVRHTRHTVRFADGLKTLAEAGDVITLEVGPGQALSRFARGVQGITACVASTRSERDESDDHQTLVQAMGGLWASGCKVTLPIQPARRVPLPTYPFQRESFWIDAPIIDAIQTRQTVGAASPRYERPSLTSPFQAPSQGIERRIAEIWADLLGVEGIGVADNFFDLGGDSLAATQMLARLRHELGLDHSLNAFFDAPTITALGALETKPIEETGEPPESLAAYGGLSFSQRRLWVIDQLEEESNAVYNMPSALALSGRLDVQALVWSMAEIYRRHEVLRTTFTKQGANPLAVIAEPGIPLVPVIDLRGCWPHPSKAEARERLQIFIALEAGTPFDLAVGPLIRARLLRLADEAHVLLINMHHIVSDGWSLGVLIRELVTLYEARVQDRPSPLPELPVQYKDYAVRQHRWMASPASEKQRGFWKDTLAGLPPLLPLPTDHPRPAELGFAGASLHWDLPVHTTHALRNLARSHNATLFLTLMAVFKLLMYRYSGADDFAVGTPVAGRTDHDLENLIGFFVNPIVLRSRVRGDESFSAFLEQVRRTALAAFDNQELPFERVVEITRPERDLSHAPLFQVMLVLQNTPGQTFRLPGLAVEGLGMHTGAAMFDLTLSLTEQAAGLSGVLEYSSELFEAETARQLMARFRMLLEAVVADPDARLLDIPMITQTERVQVLETWNDTVRHYPEARCLHEMVDLTAQRQPQAIALQFEGDTLSYSQLNGRAAALAHHLHGRGVGPDSLVGICAERSLELVVGLLGILKAGGAYVPLDPSYPEARLTFMCTDSAVDVVLMGDGVANRFGGVETVSLNDPAFKQDNYPALPSISTSVDHLAYAIYTSGSTGKPKGAMNAHRGVYNRLFWMQDAHGLNEGDRVLQKTPFSFDVSVWEFFWPLMTGARLVIARPGGHMDSRYLVDLIVEREITTLHFVPSMLRLFLETAGADQCRSLRRVFASGEALPYELQQRFFNVLVGAPLYNLYGPTEAAIDVTAWTCRRYDPRPLVPIGAPIANTRLYITDKRMRPVPVGLPGDLWIAGVNLARGYLKRPALTADRFRPNPFGGESGSRLYLTGDLARWLPDGSIAYLGRTDHQVKLRGLRIEIGEIEAVIADYPSVNDTAVIVREDNPGHQRLVAYVVAGDDLSINDLREWLGERLPDYMTPAAFVVMAALPLNPNGKLDRAALPEPERGDQGERAAYVEPSNRTEKALAELWTGFLGLERVSIHDNFFALGGDSVLAIQIVGKAHELGLRLTPRQFFQHQTIAALAKVAGEIQVIDRKRRVEGEVPITDHQRRLLAAIERGIGPVFHAYYLESGPFKREPLEIALQALVDHHDALRLRFSEGRQFHADDAVPMLRQGDAGTKADSAAIAAMWETDLLSGPMLRVFLTAHGSLVLSVNRLAADMTGLLLLAEDLETVYRQVEAGGDIDLPDKTDAFQVWSSRVSQVETPAIEWPEHATKDFAVHLETIEEPNAGEQWREVHESYHTNTTDLLAGALALALDNQGVGELGLHFNRRAGEVDLDLSRSVGPFITHHRIQPDLPAYREPGNILKGIKEQVRTAENAGLIPDAKAVLLDCWDVNDGWCLNPTEGADSLGSPEYPFRLTVRARFFGATLYVGVCYDRTWEVDGPALAGSLRQELIMLVQHCLGTESGGFTPSDFPDLEMDQYELDSLIGDLE